MSIAGLEAVGSSAGNMSAGFLIAGAVMSADSGDWVAATGITINARESAIVNPGRYLRGALKRDAPGRAVEEVQTLPKLVQLGQGS